MFPAFSFRAQAVEMEASICDGGVVMKALTVLFRPFLANLPFHVGPGREWRSRIAVLAHKRGLSRFAGR
jgi:hypothetical protein